MNAMALDALLADADQAGAYFVDARDREALVEAGIEKRFAVLPIDLRACADAAAAMREIADAMKFPAWFGENLDALADCLGDLSWLPSPGYVLVLEHADDWRAREPESFETVLDILNDAAKRWAETRTPFWTFLPVSARDLEAIGG
jgi:RNAse (barnase) inhibitor barstar